MSKRISNLLELAGSALVVIGVDRWSNPAAYIVAGALLWAYSMKAGRS
jgi:hypothetical protein